MEKPFSPHAVILTEFCIPRPIFAAAMIKAEKFKRIDFIPNSNPLTYVKQAVNQLPLGVPCYGRSTGFVVNYSTEKAVQFDREGKPVAILCTMCRIGHSQVRV